MKSLRQYQITAIEAVHKDLQTSKNVLLQQIMGAGKTVLTCRLVNKYYHTTDRRFLILAHKNELLTQFQKTFRKFTDIPEDDIGISCAGLHEKIVEKRITIASVQTFINQLESYSGCNLIIIDEAHRIQINTGSQYDQVINYLRDKNPAMRILGITATPWRLGHGRIYGPCDNLFPRLCHQTTYEELKSSGHLMPLEGKVASHPSMSEDLFGVRVSGDYVLDQLGEIMCRERHTTTAVEAMHKHCDGFKHICVFCCTIEHAETLRKLIGAEATTVHSKLTPLERNANMEAWRSGRKRIITSVNILVEGFDWPALDCIVMARPTLSAGLYLQAVGRVLRCAPGKERALLLDLTDNTARFGTDLDRIKIGVPKKVEEQLKKNFEKLCPECETIVHSARAECPECGYVWPPPEPPENAVNVPELNEVFFGKAEPKTVEVGSLKFFKHMKKDKPPSLRVEYHSHSLFGSRIASEWVCFEHSGFARQKAEDWWKEMTGDDTPPKTVDEALELTHLVSTPDEIVIEPDGKWVRIKKKIFGLVPF